MAGRTVDRRMLAEQRILGLRMIEFERGKKLFPSPCRMALLARLFERAMMRVDVARRASGKPHVLESRRPAWMIGLVALFAGNLNMQARQRVASLRVIELFRSLPIADVVAALAILA